MKRFPISLYFFFLAASIFVIQATPGVGIFFMFVGAAYWSIGLINLGFLGIGLEVFLRRVGRGWLAAPLLWYGGYFGYVSFERFMLHKVSAEMLAHNQLNALPFSPTSNSLVFKTPIASSLFKSYDVPVVYETRPLGANFWVSSGRIVDISICDKIRKEPLKDALISINYILYSEDVRRVKADPKYCSVWLPENPEYSEMIIEIPKGVLSERIFRHIVEKIVLTTPDNRKIELETGEAKALPWWPQPVLGCYLNSSRPAWECFAEFRRIPLSLPAMKYAERDDKIAVLGKALGLPPATPGKRQATPTEEIRSRINDARAKKIEEDTALLDKLLSDPSIDLGGYLTFRSLSLQPEIVFARLEPIISTIERDVDDKGPNIVNAKSLFGLLKRLPREALEPYKMRLETIKQKNDSFALDWSINAPS